MKTKKLLIIVTLVALVLLLGTSNVKAVLQSNGGTAAKKTIDQWMLQIRQMQSAGGTLGLTDTINSTGLTSTNTNLDIHMQKNTEFGAVALLSASSYGNPNVIADGETTTGNASGVVMKINKELVSADIGIPGTTYINALGRYKNKYTTSIDSAKRGDASLNWHGSGSSTWLSVSDRGIFLRAHSGSIFSYYGSGSMGSEARYDNPWPTRACIVVGSGI